MKKKIFGGIAVVAIAVAVALNVSLVNNKADKTSLLALANVEALAQGEAGGGKDYQVYSYACSMWYMDYACTSTQTHHPCVVNCGKR